MCARSTVVDRDGRRLLEDLLVAALHRALALAEVRDGAVLVAEDLDLDVAARGDVALEQQRVVAERVGGEPRASEATAASSASGRATTCMPLPPPPADGLTSSG